LVGLEADHVSFRWKDYREGSKAKVMSLATGEFIRRFLMHTRHCQLNGVEVSFPAPLG
jgi:hypothetical protein